MHTVVNLVRLSPLLVDEDDGDEDDDLSHNAQEGPESSKAATHTQMDFVGSTANFVLPSALIGTSIRVIQVSDGKRRIFGHAHD